MGEADKIAALEARVKDLELTLNQNNHDLMVAFKLTPGLSNLLGLLLSVPVVVPDMVQQRLEIATDSRVAVHRLRQQLKPHGITIQSKRCLGYWLEAADKAKVRAALVAFEEGSVPPDNETTQAAA